MSEAKKIETEISIIDGLSNDEYHKIKAASSSIIKNMRQSPAHARHKQLNPTDPTPSMQLGSAVHSFTLESHGAESIYCQRPEGMRAGTKAYEAFVLENKGKQELSFDNYNDAKAMAKAVLDHPVAGKLVRGGSREVSAFWTDEETGTYCKARPDIIREDGMIVDLKTTNDASLKGFAKQIADLGYHVQAAWYLDGLKRFTEVENFVVIAVENKAPFAVAVYYLDAAAIEKGREEYRRLLNNYVECVKTDVWPGYSEEIQPISLPAWIF